MLIFTKSVAFFVVCFVHVAQWFAMIKNSFVLARTRAGNLNKYHTRYVVDFSISQICKNLLNLTYVYPFSTSQMCKKSKLHCPFVMILNEKEEKALLFQHIRARAAARAWGRISIYMPPLTQERSII